MLSKLKSVLITKEKMIFLKDYLIFYIKGKLLQIQYIINNRLFLEFKRMLKFFLIND